MTEHVHKSTLTHTHTCKHPCTHTHTHIQHTHTHTHTHTHIYIYIYIERERERERGLQETYRRLQRLLEKTAQNFETGFHIEILLVDVLPTAKKTYNVGFSEEDNLYAVHSKGVTILAPKLLLNSHHIYKKFT